MKLKLLLITVALFVFCGRNYGQYSITGTGSSNTYTQNFDAFRGTALTLPTNWAVTTASYNAFYPILTAGAATPTVANATGNNCYAGRASSTSSDYSILQKPAASGSPTTFTFSATNNTTKTINGFVINWNVEQFNATARATTLDFKYSLNGGSYVSTGITGTTLYTSSTGSSTTYSYVNSTPTGYSITITGLSLAASGTVDFQFSIANGSGSGNNAQVGIDDFSVYANAAAPTVTTPTVTLISTTTATLGANVTSDNGAAITSRGTVWGTAAAPTGNSGTTTGTTGVFTTARTGFTPNTFYYYRGYAVNANGTGYSPDGTFTTLHNAPTVGSGSGATSSSIVANWTAPTGGGSAAYTYEIQVDDNNTFSSVNYTQNAIASGTLTATATGLSSSTTYYYRVRAVNAGGNSAWSSTSVGYATLVPSPEINVTNDSASSIPTGSSANTGYNTVFAGTSIGSSTVTKTYRIYNIGTATLNVSSVTSNNTEFVVTASAPYTIAPGSYGSFTVVFTPLISGTRSAVISIVNNDTTGSENPYTFNVEGTGDCPTTTNTITPTSGPVGTEVTINSSNSTTNTFTAATTVNFNGVSTAVTYVSATQIKVFVPLLATSGNIVTTNAQGCQVTNAFTIIDNVGNTCQGGNTASDLFISEVTDANWGGLTYVEIYNGTGVSKNLSGYSINTASNGNAYSGSPLNLSNVTLASGSTYVVALGDDDLCTTPYGDGSLAVQSTVNLGVNFKANENDHIALFNGATKIDSWGTFGSDNWATSSLSIFTTETNGATFRRKNTALTLPSTTYANADWEIIDYVGKTNADCGNNDYSNIGTYNFIAGTPPTVTTPSYTANCKTATLTISGTEGFTGGNPLTYQWLVTAPNATGWTEIANGTNYSGSSTATLSISNISNVLNYQYYCQVRENTTTCYTASNAVKIIDGTITWNGTNWIDVNNAITVPTIDKLAIINANYNTSTAGQDSFSACSVVVNSPYILTITANKYVKIQNELANSGTVTINNNGSLVQVSDDPLIINTGNITYERDYTGISTYDYTYWSTPVANQNLLAVSPTTKTDKFFSFDAEANDWLQENPSTRTMVIGKGYIIRAAPISGFPPGWLTNSFIGVPNNGVKNVPIYWNGDAIGTSNLIGNPYPSAIDAVKFLTVNSGVIESTIYFWTNATSIQNRNLIIGNNPDGTPKAGTGELAYTTDDYASFNLTGGVATGNIIPGTPPTEIVSNRPNGIIAAGQAFFTTSLLSNGTATFNNSMRVSSTNSILSNSQFFKTKNTKETTVFEKHRIWLNLTNTQGAFKQTLVGYITDATNEYDTRFDGESFDGNEFVDFYSINQEKNLVIQGRALPFDENDEVPLGFRTTINGTFTIKIDQADGVLTNQAVFIEDKLTNTIFDLRSGPFTFNTVAGTFNDRFVLRYTNKTLGTIDLETLENQVLVSNKNKQIKINSKGEPINKVMVYDLLGRLLFKKDKVNNTEFSIFNLISNSETLLVKVTLQNGETVTRKILY